MSRLVCLSCDNNDVTGVGNPAKYGFEHIGVFTFIGCNRNGDGIDDLFNGDKLFGDVIIPVLEIHDCGVIFNEFSLVLNCSLVEIHFCVVGVKGNDCDVFEFCSRTLGVIVFVKTFVVV
eukprot:210141_1